MKTPFWSGGQTEGKRRLKPKKRKVTNAMPAGHHKKPSKVRQSMILHREEPGRIRYPHSPECGGLSVRGGKCVVCGEKRSYSDCFVNPEFRVVSPDEL